ncbi:MAG: AMP-dependent synthetase/ligase [Tenuifilum sp.]|uniref:AMP-dependent synthetase/ligase n=1 Tax=Tenuifilum sp. TaxID=2760880 RepID=UPI001B5C3F27|nr:long-chain fatty acid--CoA ligase [Bacteroidales bacterium]HOK61415.1 AMP-dependent synthetase/ligase [Tenuifilum sp.]HOK86711.1 AMP-dependent synthetase/ligase [Tenuifilum sp.]HPP90137.1 AMP-dependent synthetase/ligase [Tenuifilum sp.]
MEIKRTFDILEAGKDTFENRTVIAVKKNGVWDEYTIERYSQMAHNLSYGLLSMGLRPGDKVANISGNRPEWNIVDMGITQAGMVHVPIYPTISTDEYKYILKHAEVRAIFVGDKALYQKLQPLTADLENFIGIFSTVENGDIRSWNEVLERGKQTAHEWVEELFKIKASVQPDDIATIIYTSGTTGVSKGVMLSHSNFLSNVEACKELFPLENGDIAVSFLPLSHVFERMVNYYYQSIGVSIYYADNLATIGDVIKEVKPHIFMTVPRMLEKTFDKIIAVGKDLTGLKKQIFFWAVNLGYKYNEVRNSWYYRIRLNLARKLIFSKWQKALGGRLKLIISGGAALQPRLMRVFWAAGIPVFEGYGLTETSPVIAVNHPASPGNIRIGSVGPVVPNVMVKIADDGEILMQGSSLMKGYYKAPDLTQMAIDEEGWFHTGDIGHLDDGKFLTITDRKKEIFKLSNGKYVAPQLIENKLKESFFIEQCMIVGENEKFVSALISPNFSFLHDWCSRHKIHFENNEELITIPEVIARYQKEITTVNKQLSDYEQIKRYRLVAEQWTPQTGELSPTLKLKRKVLYERYEKILEEIYGHAKQTEVRGVNKEL